MITVVLPILVSLIAISITIIACANSTEVVAEQKFGTRCSKWVSTASIGYVRTSASSVRQNTGIQG